MAASAKLGTVGKRRSFKPPSQQQYGNPLTPKSPDAFCQWGRWHRKHLQGRHPLLRGAAGAGGRALSAGQRAGMVQRAGRLVAGGGSASTAEAPWRELLVAPWRCLTAGLMPARGLLKATLTTVRLRRQCRECRSGGGGGTGASTGLTAIAKDRPAARAGSPCMRTDDRAARPDRCRTRILVRGCSPSCSRGWSRPAAGSTARSRCCHR